MKETKFKSPRADWSLLIPLFMLLTIGTIMIISSSASAGLENYGDSFHFIKKHGVFLILGVLALLMGSKIPNKLYQKWSFQGMILSVFLLILPIIPGIGVKIGGAYRWVDLGFMTFQPSEVAKFFVIVFVATAIQNKGPLMKSFKKGVLPILLAVAVPLGLLAKEPDLGTSAVILVATIVMLFLSEMPIRWLVSFMSVSAAAVVVSILTHPYQMNRVKGFLSPWEDPQGRNYHMVQSLIAIGSGGLTGLGLGESKLKFFYLPLQYCDFIFSILCEEGGFILAGFTILLFGAFGIKGLQTAAKSETAFGYYLGVGLMSMLFIQAFFNLGVVMGILPVTGIPLPFISFGGTSLLMSMFFTGVIINVTKQSQASKKSEQSDG